MCEELLLPLSSRRDHQAFDQVAAISLSRAFPVREVKMVDCNDWIQAMVGIRVIYQVYPRSFQDSDGNGVGDLNGIIDRLSDFVELGVDAIWISPVFRSPMADFGYDISDYIDIDPVFGNMADFYRLVQIPTRMGSG
jgi:1,4-alpha-glucan branching enzyme